MEVVYKEKKKSSHFIFYFPTQDKFLAPLMLSPIKKILEPLLGKMALNYFVSATTIRYQQWSKNSFFSL